MSIRIHPCCTETPLSAPPRNVERLTASPQCRVGAGSFVGTFGTQVFIQACTVAQGVLVARLLGPTGRGELAAVTLWPTLFAGVGLLGSQVAIARRSAKESDLAPVTRAAVLMALITASVTAGIGYGLLPYLIPEAEQHILPIAGMFLIFIPLNHLALNLAAVDQGAGNFRRFNRTRSLLNPTYLLLIILFWLLGFKQVLWFAAALLVANAVVALVRLSAALRSCRLKGPVLKPLKIIREGLPYGLAQGGDVVYRNLDKGFLLWLLGAENLGFYAVALAAASVSTSLGTSVGAVLFTVAAQSEEGKGFDRIAAVFRKAVIVWLVTAGAIAALLPVFVPLVYGLQFAAASTIAVVLVPGVMFGGLSHLLEQSLQGQGRAFPGVIGRFAGMLLFVAAGTAVAGRWGTVGVAAAFAASQGACLIVLLFLAKVRFRDASLSALAPRWSDVTYLIVLVKGYLSRARSRTGL